MVVAASKFTTAVVGLGLTGLSVLRHLHASDHLVVIDSREQPANLADARREFPQAQFFIGAQSSAAQRWHKVDRVVVSPGIAPEDPLLAGSENLPTLSDIDLFAASANAPVIGITGTNGKSTVTALVGHLLRELGLNVGVGGNLGEPALDLLQADTDVYVLELSSFQIEHSGELSFAVATVLNLSVDHLDRHGSMASYGAIKRQIYAAADVCVVNADDSQTQIQGQTQVQVNAAAQSVSFGKAATAQWALGDNSKLLYQGKCFAEAGDFAITGQHNLLNALAALALVVSAAAVLPALPAFAGNEPRYVAAASGFTGLEHRAEFIRELAGVRYVNDSKATNVGACAAALAGFPVRCSGQDHAPGVILLAGGQGKGADFAPLGSAAAGRVKAALVFGEDASLLATALREHTTVEASPTLEAAVERARNIARAGDTVLLAPACASFDMFSSFMARGDRFRELVEAFA